MKLNKRLGISDDVIDLIMSITEKKAMDPVGQEDGDIDNDGDKDKSDEYLKKRRKAIAKNVAKDNIDVEPSIKESKDATGVAPQAVDQHNCATHVYHEQWGDGQPIHSMHAEPDANGLIEWYDVMFDHGIEKRVPTNEMKVMQAEMHGNHKKKSKNEETLSEGGLKITYKDKNGKEHFTIVFTAKDAQDELDHIRKMGGTVIKREMA